MRPGSARTSFDPAAPSRGHSSKQQCASSCQHAHRQEQPGRAWRAQGHARAADGLALQLPIDPRREALAGPLLVLRLLAYEQIAYGAAACKQGSGGRAVNCLQCDVGGAPLLPLSSHLWRGRLRVVGQCTICSLQRGRGPALAPWGSSPVAGPSAAVAGPRRACRHSMQSADVVAGQARGGAQQRPGQARVAAAWLLHDVPRRSVRAHLPA